MQKGASPQSAETDCCLKLQAYLRLLAFPCSIHLLEQWLALLRTIGTTIWFGE